MGALYATPPERRVKAAVLLGLAWKKLTLQFHAAYFCWHRMVLGWVESGQGKIDLGGYGCDRIWSFWVGPSQVWPDKIVRGGV